MHGDVGELDLQRPPPRNESLSALSRPRRVDAVRLNGSRITNAGLRNLRGAHIGVLFVDPAHGITNGGMRALCDLPGLQEIALIGSQIDSDALACVGALTNLENLNLSGSNVDDAAFQHVAELPRIKVLNLTSTNITGKGIRRLQANTVLETLDIGGRELTDDAVAESLTLPNLKNLGIDYGTFTGKSFEHGAMTPQLSSLSIRAAAIAEGFLEGLAGSGLPLITLYLDGTTLPAEAYTRLNACATLEYLSLSDTAVDDDAVARLAGLKRLRELDLRGTRVTDAVAPAIKKALPQLETVYVARTGITEAGVDALKSGSGDLWVEVAE